MNKQEILEGNKLIEKFMGKEHDELCWKLLPKNIIHLPQYFKYHLSWDWLMPVVEKIEKINRYNEYYPDTVTIWKDCCKISDGNNGNELVCVYSGTTKIEATWLAVIDFIKWYNKNDKPK
jgi:hypothetical protein